MLNRSTSSSNAIGDSNVVWSDQKYLSSGGGRENKTNPGCSEQLKTAVNL
ncbi:MAG TPA: hypothetical protein V6C71_25595 [Coleofasciculaceae cyanobacterium]